jgi:phenylpropionate dioxygenase-like ring-hydroxylating dioxygenase large terminal subunit
MTVALDAPFTAEELAPTLRPLLEASLLPRRAYTDEDVAIWEAENLFLGGWVCVGHASALAGRGAFLTAEIGDQSLLFFAEGGYHNVCRHRGARLVTEAEGTVRRLQCPYHAWSYGFDGALKSAPHTGSLEDFDLACNGLRSIRTATIGGLVFADVSGTAPSVADHIGALEQHLDAYRTGELRRGARIDYDVAANWKAIVENYSECLHCPGVHPELNRLSHYLTGEDFGGPGAWCGGSMTLTKEDADTMALKGGRGGRPPIAGVDPRVVLYFAIFPNCLVSLHPDYVMLHTLWPRDAGRTKVVCEWFFEPETMDRKGFDGSDAIEFWDLVNRQDWHVCELAQLGMASRAYVPGRYTEVEGTVHDFDRMVAEAYLR